MSDAIVIWTEENKGQWAMEEFSKVGSDFVRTQLIRYAGAGPDDKNKKRDHAVRSEPAGDGLMRTTTTHYGTFSGPPETDFDEPIFLNEMLLGALRSGGRIVITQKCS